MKKRAAETPEGKAMMEQFWKVLDKSGPQQGDKFTTWPAVGYGFAYQMTGDKKYAEIARKIIEREALPYGSGGQDIHHGPRCLGTALAFDLCYDGWDEEFRVKVVDNLQKRVRDLAQGTFNGNKMGGFNPNIWSNHNGIRAGSYGVGAIALMGERNSDGKVLDEAPYLAATAAREIRGYISEGLSGSGFGLEGGFYKAMTMRRGFLHFLHAYEKALGKKVDPGPIGDFTMVGYFMGAEPGRLFPLARSYDGYGHDLNVDGEPLPGIAFALGWPTVPHTMKPSVKYLFDRSLGLEGDKTFGINLGLYAPYILATYPFDVAAKPPAQSFPWVAPDTRKGYFIFRPTVKDKDDLLFMVNMKGETLRGCHYERSGIVSDMILHGFGKHWLGGQYLVRANHLPGAVNIHHGATITACREPASRVMVVDMNLDRAYLSEFHVPKGERPPPPGVALAAGGKTVNVPRWGLMVDHGIRATRTLAVDCSGKSGSPMLVAILDRVNIPADAKAAVPVPAKSKPRTSPPPSDDEEGAMAVVVEEKPALPSEAVSDNVATWWLPVLPKAGPVKIQGNRFTVGDPAGPTLAGALVHPGALNPKSIVAGGDGTFFVVFTLQNGPAPEITVDGTGLSAKVKIGDRVVRMVDSTLVME
jgi:hypothetical protein